MIGLLACLVGAMKNLSDEEHLLAELGWPFARCVALVQASCQFRRSGIEDLG